MTPPEERRSHRAHPMGILGEDPNRVHGGTIRTGGADSGLGLWRYSRHSSRRSGLPLVAEAVEELSVGFDRRQLVETDS